MKKTKLSELILTRNKLVQKLKNCCQTEQLDVEKQLETIEAEICNLSEEENMRKFKDNFGPLLNTDGDTNNSIWKIKRKVFNRKGIQYPSAKYDPSGRLISNPNELKEYYLSHFIQRLRKRPINPEFEDLMKMKERLFQFRLSYVNLKPFTLWNENDLLKVLSSLKKGKSKDPYGLISKIFRPEIIGGDLFKALLSLFNAIKSQLIIPDFMTFANIIPINKPGADHSQMEGIRRIFIVNKFRDILMKLIYDEEYEEIDFNMSDSNIGARKRKNIRNHIFIIHSVINESIM